MKKITALLTGLVLCLSLAACGGKVVDTPKSEGLNSQYTFYNLSVKRLVKSLGVTPEQADEIFIALVSCGMDSYAHEAKKKDGTENTFSIGCDGEYTDYDVDILNGVVSEIRNGNNTLYPLERTEEYLNKEQVDNTTSLIEGLTLDSSRTDYEAAQVAYDALSKALKKEIPENLVLKLNEYNLSTMTTETAVESAIENARAQKDKVSITEHAGTEDELDVIVSVYLKGSDNLTTNMVRTGMLIEACDILKYLQARSEISRIALFWSLPLVDVYGNTSEDVVMKIQLEKETFQKINFDSFDWNNFSDIADDYFEHPALLK